MPEDLISILSALRECTRLVQFDFADYQSLTPGTTNASNPMTAVESFLAQNPALERFWLDTYADFVVVPGLVNSVTTHPCLKCIKLPLTPIQSPQVAQLLTHFGEQERGAFSLDLSIAILTDSGDNQGLSLRIKDFGWGQADAFENFLRSLRPIVSKVEALSIDDSGVAAENVVAIVVEVFFNNLLCDLSHLEILQWLCPKDVKKLCLGSKHYKKLKSLRLRTKGDPNRSFQLFPNCRLQNLSLKFFNVSLDAMFGFAADALQLHTSLGSLEFEPNGFPCAPVVEVVLSSFLEVLQCHPNLASLQIDTTGHAGFGEFLQLLSRVVLEQNQVLQTLLLPSECFYTDALVESIPSMKWLRRLWFAYDLNCETEIKRIYSTLKQNTSIVRFEGNESLPGHNGLDQILVRNRLLHHAQILADGHPPQNPIQLWPHVLCKVGSVENEPTPVYFFLRHCAETLVDVVPHNHTKSSGTRAKRLRKY